MGKWVGGKETKDKGRGSNGFNGLNWCREETDTTEPQGNADGSYCGLVEVDGKTQ